MVADGVDTMSSTGKRMRRRYNKGKTIRGVNNGVLGRWRKTQVDKRLSEADYKLLKENNMYACDTQDKS